MNYLLLLILFTLASCSSVRQPDKLMRSTDGQLFADEVRSNDESDNEFKVHIKRFQKYRSVVVKTYRPNDVTIVFGNEFTDEQLQYTTAACIYYKNNKREIRMNESRWFEMGPNQKEFTVYHYLVHCDLDQSGHNPVVNNQNIPISAVHSKMIEERILKHNRAHYIRDIFKNH